jgi:predicted restriction endonuclease
MCGLDVGLVQGAHIYPVSAPGALDEPWNGLALCGNHHLAFDRHVLAVRSDTLQIIFHSMILEQVRSSPAVGSLVDGTFERLAQPKIASARPKSEMFDRRYAFYVDSYAWLML